MDSHLKELNLEDDLNKETHYSYTFIGVSDKEICKELLEKILEVEIEKVEMVEEQKTIDLLAIYMHSYKETDMNAEKYI